MRKNVRIAVNGIVRVVVPRRLLAQLANQLHEDENAEEVGVINFHAQNGSSKITAVDYGDDDGTATLLAIAEEKGKKII